MYISGVDLCLMFLVTCNVTVLYPISAYALIPTCVRIITEADNYMKGT